MLLAVSLYLFRSHGVVECLSLSPVFAGSNSLLLSVTCSCWLPLTISHCCWLSLTVYPSPIEWLHVSHCHPLLLDVSYRLYQCHGVAACLSLSPIVTGCLYRSLPVPWSFCMSDCQGCRLFLTVSPVPWNCCMSLTVSPVPWSCYMSFTVSHCCWLSLTVSISAMELLHISHYPCSWRH